jgi:NADH:ubiquinone oxidoreductase subunit B-like Fe-S oxidoreductase
MPEPKFIVAVGTCACSGGVFHDCYGVLGGIDSTVPVAAYIPGCPAGPEAIIDGVVKLLEKIDSPDTVSDRVEIDAALGGASIEK